MRNLPIRGWLLGLLLLVSGLAAAQSVTIGNESALHEEPKADSRVITRLKSGVAGEMLGRQGAWVNLHTPAGSGWVLSFNVRFAPQGQAQGGNGLAAIGRAISPRQKPATTATIGIRGLEAEDLKSASFDGQQVGLLDQYAASPQAAEDAARAAGLEPVRLDYLKP